MTSVWSVFHAEIPRHSSLSVSPEVQTLKQKNRDVIVPVRVLTPFQTLGTETEKMGAALSADGAQGALKFKEHSTSFMLSGTNDFALGTMAKNVHFSKEELQKMQVRVRVDVRVRVQVRVRARGRARAKVTRRAYRRVRHPVAL